MRVRESQTMHWCCRPTRVGCIEKQPRSRQGRVTTPMSAPALFVAARVHSVAAASARKLTQQVGEKGSSKEGRSSRDPRTTRITRAARVTQPSSATLPPPRVHALVTVPSARALSKCAGQEPSESTPIPRTSSPDNVAAKRETAASTPLSRTRTWPRRGTTTLLGEGHLMIVDLP